MDRDERLDTIDRLGWENMEARAHIEERRRQRECDPLAFDDHLRAEREAEAEREALVQRDGSAGDLVYRRMENALQPAPQPDAGASDGLDPQTFASALGEAIAHERQRERRERAAAAADFERKLADLRSENLKLESLLRDVLGKLQATDEKVRNFMADLEGERRERRALEVEMAEQRGRTNAIVRDLVR